MTSRFFDLQYSQIFNECSTTYQCTSTLKQCGACCLLTNCFVVSTAQLLFCLPTFVYPLMSCSQSESWNHIQIPDTHLLYMPLSQVQCQTTLCQYLLSTLALSVKIRCISCHLSHLPSPQGAGQSQQSSNSTYSISLCLSCCIICAPEAFALMSLEPLPGRIVTKPMLHMLIMAWTTYCTPCHSHLVCWPHVIPSIDPSSLSPSRDLISQNNNKQKWSVIRDPLLDWSNLIIVSYREFCFWQPSS